MPETRFSIVAPVSTDAIPPMLGEMIASVEEQSFAGWELCLCPGQDCPPELRALVDEAVQRDSRIRIGDTADAGGVFVALIGDGDRLDPDLLATVDAAITKAPEADFAYTDEDEIDARGRHSSPTLKPGWSPDRLPVEMYTGRLAFLRRTLLEEVGGFSADLGDAAAEWDIALRVTEAARAVLHIPGPLYHRRARGDDGERTGGEERVRVVQAHCDRVGLPARVEEDPVRPGGCRLQPALKKAPPVSIVIPTNGQRREIRGVDSVLVVHCVESIVATSTYEDYEIVCVADSSTDPAVLDRLRATGGDRVRIVDYDEPFNFSAKVNLGAARSEGEQLLLLNDDMEVITPDWIERMAMYAGQAEIGAVGAQLRWEDDRIQHAGIVLEDGLPGHVYRLGVGGASGEPRGYGRNALVTQNYLAVTGACLMTPRAVFDRVGGLPIELPLNYNDIDYCLRVWEEGLRIVYDADTLLFHFESSSRNTKVERWEKEMLRSRRPAAAAPDPYSNPGLRFGQLRTGLLRRKARAAKVRLFN